MAHIAAQLRERDEDFARIGHVRAEAGLRQRCGRLHQHLERRPRQLRQRVRIGDARLSVKHAAPVAWREVPAHGARPAAPAAPAVPGPARCPRRTPGPGGVPAAPTTRAARPEPGGADGCRVQIRSAAGPRRRRPQPPWPRRSGPARRPEQAVGAGIGGIGRQRQPTVAPGAHQYLDILGTQKRQIGRQHQDLARAAREQPLLRALQRRVQTIPRIGQHHDIRRHRVALVADHRDLIDAIGCGQRAQYPMQHQAHQPAPLRLAQHRRQAALAQRPALDRHQGVTAVRIGAHAPRDNQPEGTPILGDSRADAHQWAGRPMRPGALVRFPVPRAAPPALRPTRPRAAWRSPRPAPGARPIYAP